MADVMPSPEQLLRWKAPIAAAVLGVASVGVLAAATATTNHNFWIFALWVVLTIGAIVCGLSVLFRIPRAADTMGSRRAASLGVVLAVLCATLGLAVYSNTRAHDCPTTGVCAPAAPGKGQRPQQP
jgi:hypothetical protein